MKFKGLYNETTKKENEFFIKHTEEENGVITARAVDIEGKTVAGGCLYRISQRGIYRFTRVSPALGIPLDEHGRILDDQF